MIIWLNRVAAALLSIGLLLLSACGGGGGTVLPAGNPAEVQAQTADQGIDPVDSGAREIPGAAELGSGAGLIPVDVSSLPAPRTAAKAGVDFASNRFIVFFEDIALPSALAPYLGNGANGQADSVRATDNSPLVQHPYLRKVSVNLADAYGLSLVSRVFYKDVKFAVYELSDVSDVAQLDAAMLQVLGENQGLVREVHYDYYVRAVEAVKYVPAGAEEWAITPSAATTNADVPEGMTRLTREELVDLVGSNPFGYKNDVEQSVTREVSVAPNDPQHLNKPGNANGNFTDDGTWANWRVGTVDGKAWNKTTGNSSVVVAVLDSGVRYTHQDLNDNTIVPANTAPYNAEGILTDIISKDNDPYDTVNGHGTNCAGCIGAEGNNAIGLAGMNWDVSILPMRVLNNSGSGSDSGIAEAILLADYLGVEVINLSLAGEFPERSLQLACRQATEDGLLVVAAASNDNTNAPAFPAYYPECLAVGATTLVNSSNNEDFSLQGGVLPVDTRFDARASFSNYGNWVDIAAPGVLVFTTGVSSDTNYNEATSGTSFACPYVVGCAALVWGYVDPPDKNGKRVREILMSGSRALTNFNTGANPDGFESNTSNGTVRFCDVNAALNLYDDPAWPFDAPTVTWNNPVNGQTVAGVQEIRVAVSGGEGVVRKVEFETYARHLGVVTAPVGGFYRLSWDTAYEFNRDLRLVAKVYDDKGNIVESAITVKPSNTHPAPNYSMSFDGLADNSNPAGWFEVDGGSTANGNTSWGADNTQGDVAVPSMHTSGSSATYASQSNDWLIAPIFNLNNFAGASAAFKRRHQFGTSGDAVYFIATEDDITFWFSGSDVFSGTSFQDWTTRTRSLAQWGGREVRLMWVFIEGRQQQRHQQWILARRSDGDGPCRDAADDRDQLAGAGQHGVWRRQYQHDSQRQHRSRAHRSRSTGTRRVHLGPDPR